MSYHPGYIESCHEPKCSKWYKEYKVKKDDLEYDRYSKEFCDNLEHGGFIPCGNSGQLPFCFIDGELDITQKEYKSMKRKSTCCFVFGKLCDKVCTKRRWTCCKREFSGNLEDAILYKGCKKIKLPNITDDNADP